MFKANSKDTRTLWSGFFEVFSAFCHIRVGVVQKIASVGYYK